MSEAVMKTTEGDITLRLFDEDAPKTVSNFKQLAGQGFYDGLIFHRVIDDFMIQGGCPQGTGTGGSGKNIKAEFNNRADRRHVRGVLSMARANDPNSASSQFFIMHADSTHLDGKYSAFGRVTSGIEAVDKIANAKRNASDRPVNPAKIVKITINE